MSPPAPEPTETRVTEIITAAIAPFVTSISSLSESLATVLLAVCGGECRDHRVLGREQASATADRESPIAEHLPLRMMADWEDSARVGVHALYESEFDAIVRCQGAERGKSLPPPSRTPSSVQPVIRPEIQNASTAYEALPYMTETSSFTVWDMPPKVKPALQHHTDTTTTTTQTAHYSEAEAATDAVPHTDSSTAYEARSFITTNFSDVVWDMPPKVVVAPKRRDFQSQTVKAANPTKTVQTAASTHHAPDLRIRSPPPHRYNLKAKSGFLRAIASIRRRLFADAFHVLDVVESNADTLSFLRDMCTAYKSVIASILFPARETGAELCRELESAVRDPAEYCSDSMEESAHSDEPDDQSDVDAETAVAHMDGDKYAHMNAAGYDRAPPKHVQPCAAPRTSSGPQGCMRHAQVQPVGVDVIEDEDDWRETSRRLGIPIPFYGTQEQQHRVAYRYMNKHSKRMQGRRPQAPPAFPTYSEEKKNKSHTASASLPPQKTPAVLLCS